MLIKLAMIYHFLILNRVKSSWGEKGLRAQPYARIRKFVYEGNPATGGGPDVIEIGRGRRTRQHFHAPGLGRGDVNRLLTPTFTFTIKLQLSEVRRINLTPFISSKPD